MSESCKYSQVENIHVKKRVSEQNWAKWGIKKLESHCLIDLQKSITHFLVKHLSLYLKQDQKVYSSCKV